MKMTLNANFLAIENIDLESINGGYNILSVCRAHPAVTARFYLCEITQNPWMGQTKLKRHPNQALSPSLVDEWALPSIVRMQVF